MVSCAPNYVKSFFNFVTHLFYEMKTSKVFYNICLLNDDFLKHVDVKTVLTVITIGFHIDEVYIHILDSFVDGHVVTVEVPVVVEVQHGIVLVHSARHKVND